MKIVLNGREFKKADFEKALPGACVPISIMGETLGELAVAHLPGDTPPEMPPEKNRMMQAIAGRITLLVLHTQREIATTFDTLGQADPDMLGRICERLRVYLLNTLGEVPEMLHLIDAPGCRPDSDESAAAPVRPDPAETLEYGKKLIAVAFSYLSGAEVYALLTGWIQDEHAFSLIRKVDNRDATIPEILEAARNYAGVMGTRRQRNPQMDTWLVTQLASRFLLRDEYLLDEIIDVLSIPDFVPMIEKIIAAPAGAGNVGGKAAGIIVAGQIMAAAAAEDALLQDMAIPESWYLAADQMADFLHHNGMEDLNAYKYNSIDYLRMSYDGVAKSIQNAKLPPATLQMLGVLLDDFGYAPLVVRSSSLLENRRGATFGGKYKSVFLANQGPKHVRLAKLADAVLAVFASMYSPDAIQYRRDKGLLHCTERMGVLIQKVVGQRVGPYFIPVYAGAAYAQGVPCAGAPARSKEGLVRMVVGLGTHAVNRVNNDCVSMLPLGGAGPCAQRHAEEEECGAQNYMDVLNLREERFETVETGWFLRRYGNEVSNLHQLVSVLEKGSLVSKDVFDLNTQEDDMVITFEGVLAQTDFSAKIRRLLEVLSQKMGTPVDIEFAHDGEKLYLLQCRPHMGGAPGAPAPLPAAIARQDVLFSGCGMANGLCAGLTHIVYVDPDEYALLSSQEECLAVGRALGLLNGLLPQRSFVLMGPGCWGSQGDWKRGVWVTYSDIHNAAALVEVMENKQACAAGLLYGTHFYRELAEAGILYVPLYSGQAGAVYRKGFFHAAHNQLSRLLPEYSHLADVLRVIDIPAESAGRTLTLHLNAEQGQSVAYFAGSVLEAAPAPGP